MREQTRRHILRIHAGLMIVLGLVNGLAATYGWQTGEGPMGFLRAQPLGHVGLVQAYFLMVVIGTALWLGAGGDGRRKWHAIGALAHCAVLPAYALHWDKFASYSPSGGQTRVVIVFHLVMLTVESFALWRPTRA